MSQFDHIAPDGENPTKSISEIAKIAHKLPIEVVQDIRRLDGKEADPYVWQQLRYRGFVNQVKMA